MKKISLLKSNQGFTLVELLLVIAIIGMLSTFGINSFIGYSRNQTLQQVTADFVNTLNTAKSKAYSQVKPSSIAVCSGSGAELNGYGVTLTSSSYSLIVRCSGAPATLTTTSLSNITLAPAPKTIFFEVITGGVSGEGGVVISGYGKSKTVIITPVGVINVQ